MALCLWAVLVGAVFLACFLGHDWHGYCGMGNDDGKELSSLVWVLLVLFVQSFRRVLKITFAVFWLLAEQVLLNP